MQGIGAAMIQASCKREFGFTNSSLLSVRDLQLPLPPHVRQGNGHDARLDRPRRHVHRARVPGALQGRRLPALPDFLQYQLVALTLQRL